MSKPELDGAAPTPADTPEPKNKGSLDRVLVAAMLIASLLLIVVALNNLFGGPNQSPGNAVVPLEGAATRGDQTAKVAMVVYSDFSCPFCARFAGEVQPEIEKRYVTTGRLLVAFRHVPRGLGVQAVRAAEAAACSGRQGKFWEMHDRLFIGPRQLEETAFNDYAAALNLVGDTFVDCLNGDVLEEIRSDFALAASQGITAVPTIQLGNIQADGTVRVEEQLSGVPPLDVLSKMVEEVLKTK